MDSNYLKIITSEHRGKPKLMASTSAVLEKIQHVFECGVNFITALDLDKATGKQLDIIGAKIGASRVVSVSNIEAYNLNDDDYRIYIKSKIAKNRWDGGIDSLQDLWYELFGSRLVIIDNQDMSIDVYLLGTISPTAMRLIQGDLIVPKPVSVGVRIYFFAPDRIFSYGMDNDLCTGYGGYWRHNLADDPVFTYDVAEEENTKAGYDVGIWSNEK